MFFCLEVEWLLKNFQLFIIYIIVRTKFKTEKSEADMVERKKDGEKLSKEMQRYRNKLIAKYFPRIILENGEGVLFQQFLWPEARKARLAAIDRLVQEKLKEKEEKRKTKNEMK